MQSCWSSSVRCLLWYILQRPHLANTKTMFYTMSPAVALIIAEPVSVGIQFWHDTVGFVLGFDWWLTTIIVFFTKMNDIGYRWQYYRRQPLFASTIDVLELAGVRCTLSFITLSCLVYSSSRHRHGSVTVCQGLFAPGPLCVTLTVLLCIVVDWMSLILIGCWIQHGLHTVSSWL